MVLMGGKGVVALLGGKGECGDGNCRSSGSCSVHRCAVEWLRFRRRGRLRRRPLVVVATSADVVMGEVDGCRCRWVGWSGATGGGGSATGGGCSATGGGGGGGATGGGGGGGTMAGGCWE